MTKKVLLKINNILFFLFFFGAGLNHFWHPSGYIKIIPDYIPFHPFLVMLSGIFEIIFALFFLFYQTRKFAMIVIILMLIAFIPVHIYMIKKAGFGEGALNIPLWIAWVRLPLQLVLVAWAWRSYTWSRRDSYGLPE